MQMLGGLLTGIVDLDGAVVMSRFSVIHIEAFRGLGDHSNLGAFKEAGTADALQDGAFKEMCRSR